MPTGAGIRTRRKANAMIRPTATPESTDIRQFKASAEAEAHRQRRHDGEGVGNGVQLAIGGVPVVALNVGEDREHDRRDQRADRTDDEAPRNTDSDSRSECEKDEAGDDRRKPESHRQAAAEAARDTVAENADNIMPAAIALE